MSLSTNVANLATRIATEIKTVRSLINGNATDLSTLTTTNKSNLVSAVNEVRGVATSAQTAAANAQTTANNAASINDSTTTATTVWSSTKTNTEIGARVSALVAGSPAALDTLDELANALNDDPNFAATTATALGNRVRGDAAQTFTAAQTLQARTNIAAASLVDVGDTNTDYVATFVAALS